MNTFVCQHAENIHGVLCGFDRVRFRGSVRSISYAKGFLKYLCFINVLLKFAADFFNGTSRKLRAATERLAQNTPAGKVVYLAGNRDKQEVVDALMKEHGVADDFVENCRSFEVHKNADAGLLQLRPAARKCLHYYLYLRHPRFGRMHVRIMTWFPMQVIWGAAVFTDRRTAYPADGGKESAMAKKTVGRDTTPLPAPRMRRRYGDDLRGEAVQ